MVSVPWTTTAPVTSGSASASRTVAAMSSSIGNVKWLAGVRPRSSADDIGDRVEAGRPGDDRLAIEDRHVAARRRVEGGADRATGEHDDDLGHRLASGAVGRVGRAGLVGRAGRSSAPPRSAGAGAGASWSSNGSGLAVPSSTATGSSSWAGLGRLSDFGSGPRVMIEITPMTATAIARTKMTAVVPTTSEIGPTMMIGRKLATETSIPRTPKTRPRTSSGRSSWSCVCDGMATRP